MFPIFSAPDRHAGLLSISQNRTQPLETLEPRLLFTAVPLITEFLASNDSVLDDEDGDSSDWIEIYNAGDTALDLDGWHLTDDADDLTQWAFPSVSLDPGEYLVVFASNKDRADADGTELHTNFALSAGGEYLALVEADGTTVADEYAPEYPAQSTDVSYGIAMEAATTTLIAEGDDARYTIPTGLIVGWNTVGFNDNGWSLGPTAIGYETAPADYASLIETAVPTATGSLYLRQTFNVADPDAFDTLSLGLRYDDGFVAYLNGVQVAEMFAPGSPQWNSFAVGSENHSDAQAAELEPFDLSDHLDSLLVGNNVLAIQVMNDDAQSSDLLIEPVLTASATAADPSTVAFMVVPTPGAANFFAGPIIESVTKNPPQPGANQDLIIEASVSENAGNGIDRVDLHYRINFDSELTLQMFDNGVGNDALAGDGIYTATISSSLYTAGDMVRWNITAEDTSGQTSRAPFFDDQVGNDQSAQYFGTVVTDPSVTTVLPVFTIFVEDPNAARTDAGTRASVFYDGEFYDNVYIRRRGFTTANWNKRKFKIDFNKGDDFRYSDDAPRVTEINLQSHFLEVGGSPHTSYMREVLGFAFMQEVGVAASNAFHIHIEQNGGFFGLYSFVEQVDDTFLERNGFDPDGVLYKAAGSSSVGNLRPNPTEQGYNIAQPDNGTFAELIDLTDGINESNPNRDLYLFDRINLPALINEMAAHATIIHHDRLPKNYYMYLDPETQEWTRIPWDFDMPFAVGGLLTSENYNNPLYGDSEHNQGGSDIYNHLYDAILDNPTTREMYLRRLRTLMDTYLDVSTGYFENLVNTLASQIRADAEADDLIWGAGDIDDGLNEILNISLPTRRNQLFNIYGPAGSGLIPGAQPANPALSIGTIEHTPFGDQDQEYIQVINPNAFAVDLTGWTVEGAITHTFAPGTVVAAGATLYITPSSSAFRARATGPSGGQGLFVQQWDSGHLSSFGETVTIKRANGTTAASKAYVGDPSPEQEHLRIVELHYNPTGPTPAEQLAGFTDGDQFEFIELINTSATQTLDLAGVSIDTGLGDALFVGTSTTLASDVQRRAGRVHVRRKHVQQHRRVRRRVGPAGCHRRQRRRRGITRRPRVGRRRAGPRPVLGRVFTLIYSRFGRTRHTQLRLPLPLRRRVRGLGNRPGHRRARRRPPGQRRRRVAQVLHRRRQQRPGQRHRLAELQHHARPRRRGPHPVAGRTTSAPPSTTKASPPGSTTSPSPPPAPSPSRPDNAHCSSPTSPRSPSATASRSSTASTPSPSTPATSPTAANHSSSTTPTAPPSSTSPTKTAPAPAKPTGPPPPTATAPPSSSTTPRPTTATATTGAHRSLTTAHPAATKPPASWAISPATDSSAPKTSTHSSRSGATPQHQARKPPPPTSTTAAPSAAATSTSSSTTSATAQHPTTPPATVTSPTITTPPEPPETPVAAPTRTQGTTTTQATTAAPPATTTTQATKPPSPANAPAPTSPPPNANPNPPRPQPPHPPHATPTPTRPTDPTPTSTPTPTPPSPPPNSKPPTPNAPPASSTSSNPNPPTRRPSPPPRPPHPNPASTPWHYAKPQGPYTKTHNPPAPTHAEAGGL
ncbi:CotH kinase family protein [Phycisphaeraceae bacterium D3-23]